MQVKLNRNQIGIHVSVEVPLGDGRRHIIRIDKEWKDNKWRAAKMIWHEDEKVSFREAWKFHNGFALALELMEFIDLKPEEDINSFTFVFPFSLKIVDMV